MTEVIEYKGKKWLVEFEASADENGSIEVELSPVPDLPPEPPVGTILVDDEGLPWLKHGPYWCSIERGWGIPWEELLRRSDLRQVVVVGKATDSVVRFNGVFGPEGQNKIVPADEWEDSEGSFWAEGFTEDEAPVHGYFAKVVD